MGEDTRSPEHTLTHSRHSHVSLFLFLSSPPASVHRLERTCAQLQSIVEDQEQAIKALEKAIKESVTKNHVEILLSGKITQDDLRNMFASLSSEFSSLLHRKVDQAQVESLLGGKATVGSIESLRSELTALRDSVRAGDGLDAHALKKGGADDPFARHEKQMAEMLAAIRDAQAKAREEAQRHKEEIAAAAAAANANGGGAGSGDGGAAGFAAAAEVARQARDRALLDDREKAELRARVQRMELAIQLAHAQRGAAVQAAEDQEARIEQALEARTGKLSRQLEELREACARSEADLVRVESAAERARQVKGSATTAAAHQSRELHRFMADLGDLQREVDEASRHTGARMLEVQLLPRAAELTATVVDMRNAMREQARAQARLLDSLGDARASVENDVGALYRQVRALRRRLRMHTEELARDVLRGVNEHRAALREAAAFRRDVESAFNDASDALAVRDAELRTLAAPLHDQLRAARDTALTVREDEIEARYEGEYAKLRRRYEDAREKEDAAAAAEAQAQAARHFRHQTRAKTNVGPATGDDEEKTSPSFGLNSPSWSLYGDVRDAFSPTPDPDDDLSPPHARSRPTQAHPSPPSAADILPSPPHIGRPRTSPLQPASADARRSSWADSSASSPSTSPAVEPRRVLRAASASLQRGGYTPAPDSSFQPSSPGGGPRWVRDSHTPRTGSRTHSPPTRGRSPERDEHGRLVLSPGAGDSRMPASGAARRFDLKSASRARPISGTGPRLRSASAAPAAAARFAAMTTEHADVAHSLELLRERLSIPSERSATEAAAARAPTPLASWLSPAASPAQRARPVPTPVHVYTPVAHRPGSHVAAAYASPAPLASYSPSPPASRVSSSLDAAIAIGSPLPPPHAAAAAGRKTPRSAAITTVAAAMRR